MSAGQIVAILVAAYVAVTAIRRRRAGKGWRSTIVRLGLAALLVAYAVGLLPDLPDIEEVLAALADTLGAWTYLLVAVFAFLETGAFVGLVAPGETVVVVGGVVAGQGEIDLVPLLGIVWACAALGDLTSFLVGRRLGRQFLLTHGPRFKITEARLERVEGYFENHGGKTILIGRFLGFVRAIAPFIAGSSGMRLRRFLPYSVIGTALWGALYTLLGFFFYRSFAELTRIAGQATLAFGAVVAVVVGIVYAVRLKRRPEERERLLAFVERHRDRPLVRPFARAAAALWRRLEPLVRRAGPPLAALGERLRPGVFELELISALAITGVGAYAFGLYVHLLGDGTGQTPADQTLHDLAANVEAGWMVEIAKVVTAAGGLAVYPVVATVAVLLGRRRLWPELFALLGGLAALYVAVHLAKNGLDRVRPPDPLVSTRLSSFPSGHAAYATAYTAAAVAALRLIREAAVGRAALVAGALLLTLAVGLSRLYLRAHWWSDVAAGWGLGFAVFGLAAAAALVVIHVRKTPRVSASPATR